jgi:peptidoglycan/LPS O-acetylase OafA/YrhL
MVAGPVFRYFFANYLMEAGYDHMMTGEIVYAFTFCQFDAFAFGAAIPIFKLDEKLKKLNLLTVLVVVSSLLIGLVNWWLLRMNNPNYSFLSLGYSVAEIENYQHVWSYSIINILFTVVIILLIQPSYRGLFNNKILVNIGKVVYGMYIIHFGILYFMFKWNQKYLHSVSVSFALAFLIAFVLAYISYNYYEKKFLALKDLRL